MPLNSLLFCAPQEGNRRVDQLECQEIVSSSIILQFIHVQTLLPLFLFSYISSTILQKYISKQQEMYYSISGRQGIIASLTAATILLKSLATRTRTGEEISMIWYIPTTQTADILTEPLGLRVHGHCVHYQLNRWLVLWV
jgi:hypothetical protein